MQKTLEVANGESKRMLFHSFEIAIEKIKDTKVKNKWKKIMQSHKEKHC